MNPFPAYRILITAFTTLRAGPGGPAERALRARIVLEPLGEQTFPLPLRAKWKATLLQLDRLCESRDGFASSECDSTMMSVADSLISLAVALCASADESIRLHSLKPK